MRPTRQDVRCASRITARAIAAATLASAVALGGCTGTDEPGPPPDASVPTSATPRITDEAGRTDALQQALAHEHEAVYLYGLAAGPLRKRELRRARTAIDVHRARRDELVALLRAATPPASPTPARPTYAVPRAATGSASTADATSTAGATAPTGTSAPVPRTRPEARAVLAAVELRLVADYELLADAPDAETADLAARAAQDARERADAWTGTSEPDRTAP